MQSPQTLFTSESVTEGHPDKLCDQISDAVLDAIMAADPLGRVACETATTTGLVLVFGEITTSAYVDIQSLVREVINDIGFTIARPASTPIPAGSWPRSRSSRARSRWRDRRSKSVAATMKTREMSSALVTRG